MWSQHKNASSSLLSFYIIVNNCLLKVCFLINKGPKDPNKTEHVKKKTQTIKYIEILLLSLHLTFWGRCLTINKSFKIYIFCIKSRSKTLNWNNYSIRKRSNIYIFKSTWCSHLRNYSATVIQNKEKSIEIQSSSFSAEKLYRMQTSNNRCALIKEHFKKYTCQYLCLLETDIK